MMDRMRVVCLSREISPWAARPYGAAHEDYDDARLHACCLWYLREHRMRLLVIVGLYNASAEAATAAAADAADLAAAVICRMVEVGRCG